MARRGRRGRAHHKAKASAFAVAKQPTSGATSFRNAAPPATPRVHPATNDCYPLNKLCRLCLLSNTNMEPIFPYPGDNRLAEKIFQCTNLQIKETVDSGIPTSLCGQCKKQLDQCYEFRLLCWKNDEILHNLHAILSPNKRTTVARTPMPVSQQVQVKAQAQAEAVTRSNPVVQVQKLNITPAVMPSPPKRGKRTVTSFGEVPLSQLYTPSRRGHRAGKGSPTKFTRDLVVRLSPVPTTLLNKYKKATVTQTKAAMKSFPQSSPKARGRPKVVVKHVVKTVVKRLAKPTAIPNAKAQAQAQAKAKAQAQAAKAKAQAQAKAKAQAQAAKAKAQAQAAKAKAQAKAKAEQKKKAAAAAQKQKAKRVEIAVPPKKRKENYETPPTVTTATCVLCTQVFNSVKGLSRHMATHENNRKNNRVYNCTICKKEYLKASQLTEHLESTSHNENAARNGGAEDGEVSILPDESEPEVSILPDDAEVSILPDDQSTTAADANISVESSEPPEPEPQPEEVTDRSTAEEEEVERRQPSPDTNENSQQNEPAQDAVDAATESADPDPEPETDVQQPVAEEVSTNRDASPIPVDSESSRELDGGVQYSDVCSTNNAENLLNGSGADPYNASRRVTFSDITEIVE